MVANLLAAIGDDDQYVLYRLHTERNTEIEREREIVIQSFVCREDGVWRERKRKREKERWDWLFRNDGDEGRQNH